MPTLIPVGCLTVAANILKKVKYNRRRSAPDQPEVSVINQGDQPEVSVLSFIGLAFVEKISICDESI